ncbi:hypothetical protein GTW25_13885 [Aliihoeflea aestuarii]|jgi:hypothetical protein|uniref:hypothetical protein n=1 Tax=Aliihoeflea aestuarii TaxID=453840 RepID=UPI0020954C5A|nr:hypothetical protein [Aliihoeflea aestuarii]MCO6392122.1 hypothetical protein [Aliihoeflea aestuarii]
MSFCRSSFRRMAVCAVIGSAAALSACQSGDGAAVAASDTQTVNIEELRAFCPRVVLQSDGAVWSQFERGGEGDASRLVHRTTIAETTRACSYAPGQITLNVAAAGRVVPGPAGRAGQVSVPILVEARRGSEVIYSNRVNYAVQVGDTVGATQFVFNDPSVIIPQEGAQQTQIIVRIDTPGS